MATVARTADNWTGLYTEPIPMAEVSAWAVRPDCGALVTFAGTVRDHAEGRPGVTELEYEAYEEHVVNRLEDIVAEARRRWSLGAVALVHRVGRMVPTECSVFVAVSAGHRPEAFEAARFCIDSLKSSVPIWKAEHWEGGVDWGLEAKPVEAVGDPG